MGKMVDYVWDVFMSYGSRYINLFRWYWFEFVFSQEYNIEKNGLVRIGVLIFRKSKFNIES